MDNFRSVSSKIKPSLLGSITLDKLIASLAILALFSTPTNFVPISALLLLVLPLFWIGRSRAPKFMVPLWIFATSALTSTIIYDPLSLIDFDFFRRDGNFFVSFAPIFLLSYLTIHLNYENIFRRWLYWCFSLYLCVFVYWLLSNDGSSFGGLFTARNAVGGFLAQITCLAYAFGRTRNRAFYLTAALIMVFMVATLSRGSILAAVASIALCEWHLRVNNLLTRRALAYASFLVLFAASFYLGFINIDIYKETFAQGFDYFGEAETGKEANVAIRLFDVWPKAVDLFLQAPIFGVGFGAFDDQIAIHEIVPGISAVSAKSIQHTESHAHNTYLHVLAEQGLFGFFLLAAFLAGIYKFLERQIRSEIEPATLYLFASFLSLVFAAFTEHRLFTPSMALPFTIPLGIFLASTNRGHVRFTLREGKSSTDSGI